MVAAAILALVACSSEPSDEQVEEKVDEVLLRMSAVAAKHEGCPGRLAYLDRQVNLDYLVKIDSTREALEELDEVLGLLDELEQDAYLVRC